MDVSPARTSSEHSPGTDPPAATEPHRPATHASGRRPRHRRNQNSSHEFHPDYPPGSLRIGNPLKELGRYPVTYRMRPFSFRGRCWVTVRTLTRCAPDASCAIASTIGSRSSPPLSGARWGDRLDGPTGPRGPPHLGSSLGLPNARERPHRAQFAHSIPSQTPGRLQPSPAADTHTLPTVNPLRERLLRLSIPPGRGSASHGGPG
ncbi:hypothetical protein VT03_09930 [Planctomyces sp. SH-PL14]|nr:hypothetical protein VT03_09930 [Planctomyces sp. SH-PL14]